MEASSERKTEFVAPSGLLARTRAVMAQLTEEMGLFWKSTDIVVLTRYAYTLDRYFRTQAAIRREGEVLPSPRYGMKTNPRMHHLAEAERSLRADEATLGLTPQSRLRLGIVFASNVTALERLKGGAAPARPAPIRTVNEEDDE